MIHLLHAVAFLFLPEAQAAESLPQLGWSKIYIKKFMRAHDIIQMNARSLKPISCVVSTENVRKGSTLNELINDAPKKGFEAVVEKLLHNMGTVELGSSEFMKKPLNQWNAVAKPNLANVFNAALPIDADVHNALRDASSYAGTSFGKNGEDGSFFNIFSGQEKLESEFNIPASNTSSYNCNSDLNLSIDKLKKTADGMDRLAKYYHDLMDQNKRIITKVAKLLDGKFFVDVKGSKCEGTKDVLDGIANEQMHQMESLDNLEKYNKKRASQLREFSAQLELVRDRCKSMGRFQ